MNQNIAQSGKGEILTPPPHTIRRRQGYGGTSLACGSALGGSQSLFRQVAGIMDPPSLKNFGETSVHPPFFDRY